MTERLAFAGQALLRPDPDFLRDLLAYLPEGERYGAVLPEREELLREHTRLFFAPEGAPCPPWQSVHGEEPTVMGSSHHSAMEWYRAAGVEPAEETEPADHAGLLLSFYARMVEAGAGEEERASFRAQHLEWLPAFCDALEAHARLEFFRMLARDTREALTSE